MLGSMSSHLRVLVGQLEDLTLRGRRNPPRQLADQTLPQAGRRPARANRINHDQAVLAAELGTVSETFSRTLQIVFSTSAVNLICG
jgi:hypothetical protein